MNKKIILTSIVAIAFAMPAMAEPQNTSATFPADDYMQEDTTYTGQATYGNMGVYEGEVTAQAEYEDILYNIAAGQYLPAASTSGAQCTAGNFCTGLTGATYNENSAQGLTACSTLESGAYPNSVAGASANTDCYRACTTQNANIAHATAVSGNDYYGAGGDTCYPTACESGYFTVNWVDMYNNFLGASILPAYGLDRTIVPGHGQIFLSAQQAGKENIGVRFEFIWNRRSAPRWSYTTDNLQDEANQDDACALYVRVNGFFHGFTGDLGPDTDTGVQEQMISPWIVLEDMCTSGTLGDVISGIPQEAVGDQITAYTDDLLRQFFNDGIMFDDQSVRNVFNKITNFARCVPNLIQINWSDAEEGAIIENNAGQCTYGGDIRTPIQAIDKTNIGKRFKGWKFVKPNNNQ